MKIWTERRERKLGRWTIVTNCHKPSKLVPYASYSIKIRIWVKHSKGRTVTFDIAGSDLRSCDQGKLRTLVFRQAKEFMYQTAQLHSKEKICQKD